MRERERARGWGVWGCLPVFFCLPCLGRWSFVCYCLACLPCFFLHALFARPLAAQDSGVGRKRTWDKESDVRAEKTRPFFFFDVNVDTNKDFPPH